jgi:hypothetical protein
LGKNGVEFKMLDSECRDLAGSFGFEKDHNEVAMKAGKRVLLPAIREENKDAIILTDLEQIAQGTERKVVHLAELMHPAFTGDAVK